MKTFEIETFPESIFVRKGDFVENPKFDDTIRIFLVPYFWAVQWIKKQYNMSLEQFLKEYTWDDSLQMYNDAWFVCGIISESIIPREVYGVY